MNVKHTHTNPPPHTYLAEQRKLVMKTQMSLASPSLPLSPIPNAPCPRRVHFSLFLLSLALAPLLSVVYVCGILVQEKARPCAALFHGAGGADGVR